MKKKNRRRNLVIVFVSSIIMILLGTLLICSGTQTGTAAAKTQEIKTVSKAGQSKTEISREVFSESETKLSEETKQQETQLQQNTEKMKNAIPSVNSDTRLNSSADTSEMPAETKSNAESKQETKSHKHSYQLVDTKKTDHPAVTKQVWVEDNAAWDEVIRSGYHMSVVTCHQCGAQFSDPAQANALEAWGDHIDAAHEGDGSYDMAASYDVPAETVHHEATGHYEQKIVSAAWTEYIDTYWCSCGDQYTKTR